MVIVTELMLCSKSVIFLGGVLGQQTLNSTLVNGRTMVESLYHNFGLVKAIKFHAFYTRFLKSFFCAFVKKSAHLIYMGESSKNFQD